jgi:histidinol-phosphate aminotransferase
MERRVFVRTGLAAGIAGTALLPSFTRTARAIPIPRSRPGAKVIKLSQNENPLGLSEGARQAIIDALGEANRYPGEYREQLVTALAAKHGVETRQLVMGTGSTEVLQMAVQFLGPNATMVVAEPTYEDVPRYAERIGTKVEKVPLKADYSHDLDRMKAVTERISGPVLVFICNPNNPTGTITPSADVDAWIQSAPANLTFVVDEAYYEYADDARYWTAKKLLATHANVLVARTFSKIYAMAGMRLGYAIAHPDLAARLARYAAQNNGNQLALVAGKASLGDDAFARKSVQLNKQGRDILTHCLGDLGLETLPSHTNFTMHRIPGELRAYNDRMREKGFIVGRPFPPMLTYSRVSIGLPEEMEAFTEALRDFRKQGWV